MKDSYRDWDAAYVLGALGADDRRTFELHLATCADCTAAVAQLAGLPGILGKLPVADALALQAEPDDAPINDAHLLGGTHTPGLVQRLAVSASRRRRRVRLSLFASAAAIVAVIAVGGIAYTGSLHAAQPELASAVAMTPSQGSDIAANLSITTKGWGTRFDWSCSYLGNSWKTDPDESYDLVVTEKSGVQATVASWTTAGPKSAGLSASTSIPVTDIRSVTIRRSGTTTSLLWENL